MNWQAIANAIHLAVRQALKDRYHLCTFSYDEAGRIVEELRALGFKGARRFGSFRSSERYWLSF